MKLKNKKTGEIGELHYEPDKEYHFTVATEDPADMMIFKTLSELNEEWEDYEEPKGYWYYDTTCARVEKLNHNEDKEIDSSIGNCFETKEEAEKAVEKLKAWKRLRDKGFRFNDWHARLKNGVTIYACCDEGDGIVDDLNMLFGSEE